MVQKPPKEKTEIRVIPLSINDLTGATYHMDATEFGAYFRLLLVHYRMGEDGLPLDDEKLARWSGCSMKQWKRVKPTLMEKFTIVEKDGMPKIVQARTVLEIQTIISRSTIARDNVLKRWKPDDTDVSSSYQVGNTTLNLNLNPKGKTPPNPPTGGRVGVFEKKDLGGITFSIMPLLDDIALAEARRSADGWDIYRLAEIYNEGVNNGSRERPKMPRKAFPAWCAAYTKGNKP